jgi:ABC-type amino acid transport substrate-binding protein
MLALATSSLLAQERKNSLRIDVRDIPPMFVFGKDGSLSGLTIDILDYLESRTKLKFAYDKRDLVSTKRLEENLAEGAADLAFGFNKTPEREARLVFGESLYEVYPVVLMRKDDTQDFRTLGDLKALGAKGIVLTTTGSAMAQELNAVGLTVDDGASTLEKNLYKLLAGWGRVVISTNLASYFVVSSLGYKDREVKFVSLDFSSNPIFRGASQFVIYSPKLPTEIVETINAAIAGAKENGDWAKLVRKYFE